MIRVEGQRFVDELGRTLVLRGVNFGGNAKLPRVGESFVGRPCPLDEAGEHFARLRRWGLTTVRLLVTWEAVEHEGPGQYDVAYLDYLEALVRRAADFELDVFIDFHQDVWSRFTGGDGAPRWTLEAAGFDVDAMHETGAAFLESHHRGPMPRMIWPTNLGKLGCATMFTLFFGGDTFAPRTLIEGASAQRFLQTHFFATVEQVVRRVARQRHVFGVDLLNEPSAGFIGWSDLLKARAPVEVGLMPSALESMALGMGQSLEVKRFQRGLLGPRVVGRQRVNPAQRRVWRSTCPWLEHGVWQPGEPPKLLKSRYFSHVGERAVSFAEDFLKPFFVEGARRIHRLAPDLAVLLQGEPLQAGPSWSVGEGPAAWAPHWYDGFVLFMKEYRSFIAADAFTQRPVFGAQRIRRSFAQQLNRLVSEASERGVPLLVGELGISFDLRGGRAFRTGDYSEQRAAMNRTLTAVEDAGVSATLWNYTADNTHARGDGWNGEDLSIFSVDGPGDDGARARDAVIRPRPLALAGSLVRYGFDLESRCFEVTLRRDQAIDAPSEFFVPQLHYPRGVHFTVSHGDVSYDAAQQRAHWRHGAGDLQTLRGVPRD